MPDTSTSRRVNLAGLGVVRDVHRVRPACVKRRFDHMALRGRLSAAREN